MNARLYDPIVGRFLSPDPYVQAPFMSQNFNRYSYGLNNPLRYTDPSGELAWFIPVITGLVGGFVNMAATWNSADGFWEHFAAFGVGAAAGVAAPFTGGSSYWTVAGVATASGATVAASNSVIAQTGTNFSGMGNVNWGQVGISAGVGGVSSFAGGSAGYWASKASFVVNGISSPALRSAVVSPISSAAGHVAGGTTAGLIQGQSLGDAFYNSFDGIGANMAMGTVIGVGTTTGTSYASKVNPFNGNIIYPDNNGAVPGSESLEYLMPGDKIDRYGGNKGSYFSEPGTPVSARSLPPNNNGTYNQYEVLKPIPVEKSTIAPWFGQPGGGVQYKTHLSVSELLQQGYIK